MALYVGEAGPLGAPTIVFLHGGGVSGWMWQPQVERLGDYHCLVPDLPEHGRSAGEQPFTVKDSAARIAEIIRTRAHGGRAHVVGLSLGAQVVVELLSRSPEVVRHAVISGTLVRPVRGVRLITVAVRLYMPFKNFNFLIRANMRSLGVPAGYFPAFRADTRLTTADSLARVLAENMSFRIPAELDRANAPTLVVVGQRETGVMHQSAIDLVAALPRARGAIAAKLGHNWSLQAPALFTAVVRAWIDDQPLPPGLLPLS